MDIESDGVKSDEMSEQDSKLKENINKDVPGDMSSKLGEMDFTAPGENGEASLPREENEESLDHSEEELLKRNEDEGEDVDMDDEGENDLLNADVKEPDSRENELDDENGEGVVSSEKAEETETPNKSSDSKDEEKIDDTVEAEVNSVRENDTNGETNENSEEPCAMETDEVSNSPEKDSVPVSDDSAAIIKHVTEEQNDQVMSDLGKSGDETPELSKGKETSSEATHSTASSVDNVVDDKVDSSNSNHAGDNTSSNVPCSESANKQESASLQMCSITSINSPLKKPKTECDDSIDGNSNVNNKSNSAIAPDVDTKTNNDASRNDDSINDSVSAKDKSENVSASEVDEANVSEKEIASTVKPSLETTTIKKEGEESSSDVSKVNKDKSEPETTPKQPESVSEASDVNATTIKTEPGVNSNVVDNKTTADSSEPSTKTPAEENKTVEPTKESVPETNDKTSTTTTTPPPPPTPPAPVSKDTTASKDKPTESKEPKSDVKIKEEVHSPGPDSSQDKDAASKPAETKKTPSGENEESASQGSETDAQKKSSSNTRTCAECGVGKGLKYQVLFQGKTRFLCSDVCFKSFRSKQKLTQPPPSQGSKSSETCGICNRDIKNGQGFFPFSGDSKPVCSEECMVKYQQAHTPKPCCSQCKAPIEGRTKCLIWETMEFCNEDCLGSYQATMGSHCACCKAAVQRLSLGKYCVRFGADIRQFCSGKCLEEFKKGLKVCTFCQKDMSNTSEGFLAPVGDKFRDFCTSECMEQYETLNASTATRPTVQKCSVCQKVAAVKVQVHHKDRDHVLCSDPCIAAFRYTQKIYASLCDLCHKLFNNQPLCLQIDNNVKKFCTKTCLNLFILAHRKIVPCTWCKVKKYNFDMIERVDVSNNVQQFCSLNCLSLFRVSLNATSSRCIKCDHCHMNLPAQYHLTMSDASIRNFCSYPCVIKFQGQFTSVPTLTTVTPNLNRQGPTPVGKATSAVSSTPTTTNNDSTPVIANVMSLAGATPTPVSVSPAQKGSSQSQTNSSASGATTNGLSVMREVHREVIVAPPVPRMLKNKMIMCKPLVQNKGVACKPHPCHKETQTDDAAWGTPVIMPVPFPVYIPSPVHMYSRSVPFPMPFPIPIPVPVFIPTTRTTTAKVIKDIFEIQEKVPSNPYEAELLLMAEMVAADEVKNEEDRKKEEAEEEEEAKAVPKKEENSKEDLEAAPDPSLSEPLEDLEVAVPAPQIIPMDELEPVVHLTPIASDFLNEQFSEDSMVPDDITKYPTPTNSTSRRGTKRRGGGRGRGRGRKRQKVVLDSDTSDEEWLPTEPPVETVPVTTRTPAASKVLATPVPKASATPPIPVSPVAGAAASAKQDLKPGSEAGSPDANLCLKYMFGVNAWKHWVVQKNIQLEKGGSLSRRLKLFKPDLLQLTPDELNYSLCLFVKEVRKPNGEEYAPDSIYYLCLGIQMYLYENCRIDNIFTDAYYEKFTECLNDVLMKHDIIGTLRKEAHFVSRIEEEILWESKQLGAHSPQVLLNTLTYFNTKLFFLHTVDDHLQLSFTYIMKGWRKVYNNSAGKGSRCAVLRYYPPPARGTPENKKGWREDAFTYEQEENFDNPLRCPVKLYEFYLSKCPESVRQRNDLFYMCPERSCVPDSPVWYSTQALPKETLVKMLQRISLVREISAPAPAAASENRATSD